MLNEDYRDMLRTLSEEKVRFLLVGAYAVAAHGYPRATMDIDIWVMPVNGSLTGSLDVGQFAGGPLGQGTPPAVQRARFGAFLLA